MIDLGRNLHDSIWRVKVLLLQVVSIFCLVCFDNSRGY